MPGKMKVRPIDIVCKEPCDGILTWFENILSNVTDRREVSIDIDDNGGTVTWDLDFCFPYEMQTELRPDGKRLYWRFSIQCEDIVTSTNAGNSHLPILPHYPSSTSNQEQDKVPPPLQQINNSIDFDFFPHGDNVDLRTLRISVELTEWEDSMHPFLRYIPGQPHWGDFDVLCDGSCPDLEIWHAAVLSGTFTRKTGVLFIWDDLGAYDQDWDLIDCFPASMGSVISADGMRSYKRFIMACDMLVPNVYTP
jgi:hypothetical protein